MAQFRYVTDRVSVAPQVSAADMAGARREGFTAVICNRPDGEDLGQPRTSDIEAAAAAAGLTFRHAPFQGPPTEEAIEAIMSLITDPNQRVLAFCRSGTRSITAWSIAAAASGAMAPDDIVDAARAAGYDLGALKDLLHSVAQRV
jgi:sulfide:quinone oxidoreductase